MKHEKIMLYYKVPGHWDFSRSANALLWFLKQARQKFPDANLSLMLDIKGHQVDKDGTFDNDMFQLQYDFITKILGEHLKSVSLPLGRFINPDPMKSIPDEILCCGEKIIGEKDNDQSGAVIQ